MKKAILTIAIAVMGLTAAFAQDTTKRARRAMPKMTAEQRAEKVTSRLEKQLSLNDDQKNKIYAIELENAKKMEAWRTADKSDMKGKMKERKAAIDEQKAKVDAVLTADQKAKMDAFRAEAKEKGGKMRKGMGGRGKKDSAPVVSNPPAQG
jgi:periplasmic protein CpxP/Spy